MSIVSSRQGLAGKHRNPLFGQRAQREEAIVRRRENERMKNEFWFSTAKYFGQIHNQTERFSQWTSPDSIKKRWVLPVFSWRYPDISFLPQRRSFPKGEISRDQEREPDVAQEQIEGLADGRGVPRPRANEEIAGRSRS